MFFTARAYSLASMDEQDLDAFVDSCLDKLRERKQCDMHKWMRAQVALLFDVP